MTTLTDVIRRAIAGHVGVAFDDAPPHRRSYIEQRLTRSDWTCNTVTQEDLTDAAQAALTALQESGYVVEKADAAKYWEQAFEGLLRAKYTQKAASGDITSTEATSYVEQGMATARAQHSAMLKAAQGEG